MRAAAAARKARAAYAAAVKNARACETATEPRCRCFCKGAAHGRGHRRELRAERDRIEQDYGAAIGDATLELEL